MALPAATADPRRTILMDVPEQPPAARPVSRAEVNPRGRPLPARVSLERQTPASQQVEGRQHPVRIARFSIDGNVAFGAVEGDGARRPDGLVLDIIKGIPFADFELSGTKVPLSKVRLLPPGAAQQGRRHRPQLRRPRARSSATRSPTRRCAFFKPSTSVIGPGDADRLPRPSPQDVHYEAELAVVIGRLCREVPRERVKDVILGYTCANDVTARDTQQTREAVGPGQGLRHLLPARPLDRDRPRPARDLAITRTVNGELRQARPHQRR